MFSELDPLFLNVELQISSSTEHNIIIKYIVQNTKSSTDSE